MTHACTLLTIVGNEEVASCPLPTGQKSPRTGLLPSRTGSSPHCHRKVGLQHPGTWQNHGAARRILVGTTHQDSTNIQHWAALLYQQLAIIFPHSASFRTLQLTHLIHLSHLLKTRLELVQTPKRHPVCVSVSDTHSYLLQRRHMPTYSQFIHTQRTSGNSPCSFKIMLLLYSTRLYKLYKSQA